MITCHDWRGWNEIIVWYVGFACVCGTNCYEGQSSSLYFTSFPYMKGSQFSTYNIDGNKKLEDSIWLELFNSKNGESDHHCLEKKNFHSRNQRVLSPTIGYVNRGIRTWKFSLGDVTRRCWSIYSLGPDEMTVDSTKNSLKRWFTEN